MELLNITQKVSAPGGTKPFPEVDIPSAASKWARNNEPVKVPVADRLKS